ncbi:zinc-binding dehydrogenase [Paenibacillus chondroitinus]|uniref:Zinc-binding dehydrogenase n=1 Tax=Paenibacillus chondroitinus TaxID=59842 RepID=A0ABU6D443_9BACL|nr:MULTISPECIES: zinc-binding dehydrogenase [Paenibacillus]MCY9661255.1 zinc-binding dehydrogenase [Paenibacillus anseongense]MEB4792509.1 zinc-binding dehydrogenase [Paenibacillus chondroitinus]
MAQMMKAALIKTYSGVSGIEFGETLIPQIDSNEVLIKVHAASINPADLLFLSGNYGIKRALPSVGGMEGCGTVIATGNSLVARMLKGKRVAFVSEVYGSWSEYTKTSVMTCMVLPDHVSDEQGAVFFVNPASAMAMVKIAKQHKSKAIVQTAGASALGRILVKLGRDNGLAVISVVRKDEHAQLLREIGGQHIVNSSSPAFEDELRRKSHDLGATVCFDAIGGDLTGTVLSALPDGSTLFQYGLLGGSTTTINADDLVFRRKRITGFWASDWVKTQSIFELLSLQGSMKKSVGSQIQTEISQTFSLCQTVDAIQQYAANMTSGKVLLRPV